MAGRRRVRGAVLLSLLLTSVLGGTRAECKWVREGAGGCSECWGEEICEEKRVVWEGDGRIRKEVIFYSQNCT